MKLKRHEFAHQSIAEGLGVVTGYLIIGEKERFIREECCHQNETKKCWYQADPPRIVTAVRQFNETWQL